MKKLLALVLALVMTLSLCVVSSNAKFDDAADISYTEAADVMQAAGVFVGDGSGKFYPTQNLTRAQAAKVIAYLDLGDSVAEALPAVQMFSDVPATHWAAKYIAYCADAGIVAGVGGGKFNPEAQVTGYEFAKMLLVVLNYDAKIEKLTGSTWSISCAKLVKENKLAKGFKSSLNDGLTREGAAQLAFRAIQAVEVDSYSGYGLTLGNNNEIVTKSNGQAQKATGALKVLKDYLWHNDNDAPYLTSKDDDNKLGDPATKWVWKNAKVGTYADTPVLTYTTEWTWAQAKADLEAAGIEIDTVDNNYTQDVTIYTNGYVCAGDTKTAGKMLKELVTDNTKQGGNGVITNFYANGDDYLERVTETTYVLAEVTGIVKDLNSTKLVNEAALTFDNIATKVASDSNGAMGFGDVYANAAKGDKLLVAVTSETGNNTVKSVLAPVVKEGKLTANGSKSCKLDGELYTKAELCAALTTTDASNEVKLYCDELGYVYGTGLVSTASKLVCVTDVYDSLVKGKITKMAEVVYADGTTGDLKIKNTGVPAVGTICTYTEGDDGVYTLTAANTDLNVATSAAAGTGYKETTVTLKAGALKLKIATGENLYFSDDVKTIFFYGKKAETDYTEGVKTVVADGVKEVKNGATVYYTINNNTDKEINALFVAQKPANTITGTSGLVYIASATAPFTAYDKEGNKVTVRSYDAYVDGKLLDEFYVVGGGNIANKFYELEDDVDVENGYLLDTLYVDYNGLANEEDVQEVVGTVKSSGLLRTDAIEFSGSSETIKVDENTKFVDVCDTDLYTVESLNGLIEDLRSADAKSTTTASADIAALYDLDTGVALYVYVGKIQ